MPKLKSYIIGFLLSAALTLAAYFAVLEHVRSHHQVFSHGALIAAIAVLALIQLVAQLSFFLHLGRSSRWNKVIFLSTVSIILILVVGSIWIMNHLNYSMNPQQMNDYLIKNEGF